VALYERVSREFPALNILINNAGIMRKINLQDKGGDLEDISREIETNLIGPVRMVKQFLYTKGSPMMDVKKLVRQAISGMQKDHLEILPCLSRVLRLVSRIAPGLAVKAASGPVDARALRIIAMRGVAPRFVQGALP
jgi:NAD(P)-dependent dehydrogenase (short-subunit alcohol dehydrogenase family)